MKLVIAAVLVALLAGCGEALASVAVAKPISQATKTAGPSHRLGPQFNGVATDLLREDIEGFTQGSETIVGEGLSPTVAEDVARL